MKVLKYKNNFDYSYALGATLVYELINNRPELARRVYISSSTDMTEHITALLDKCRSLGIPVETNDKAFNILSPKGNCFVIAEFSKREAAIHSESKHECILEKGNHLLLVNPSDAGNLGTIIRTATGFGFKNIAIIRPAVDFYDPKTIRATMGAAFHVNVQYFDCIEDYLKIFPENNRYAFMLTASVPIHNIEIKEPYSLILGNEATGLPEEYATFCKSIIIPHSHEIDSLNLPIAASIGMYEFSKMRF